MLLSTLDSTLLQHSKDNSNYNIAYKVNLLKIHLLNFAVQIFPVQSQIKVSLPVLRCQAYSTSKIYVYTVCVSVCVWVGDDSREAKQAA